HLKDRLWFKDEDDFKVGMNYVAVLSATRPALILSFVLMSNHVHFVLESMQADATNFINEFKTIYSKYFRRKYLSKELLRENKIDIQEVSTNDEGLERAIAYVQMNSVAANICSHPSQWPWGTGNSFFNRNKPAGRAVSSLSRRALYRLTHSGFDGLPGEWIICNDGYFLPEMYVDVSFVESRFHSPNRMNYFLSSSSKAKKRFESTSDNLPAFRDQSILVAIPDLCRSLFQKASFKDLSDDDRSELVRQIRFRFSADAKQIARICGISYEEAAKLLDRL
ncbi:MAG: transposase, partial [Bacteroidales bacterium]|nr:transposase [Bacteroidales bacterium]